MSAGFVFLFIIVWWAWFNGSSYHDIHGNNDIRTRVFTFLQMFTVAAMAVFAHDALGESSVGFALAFAAFLVTTLLFVGSLFVPSPIRFYLWGIAVVISLILPFNAFRQDKKNPAIQEEVDRIIDVSPTLVERFGLLSIIVLGEVVIGTINGIAGHDQLDWAVGITAVLGMLIATSLWWVYFDFISHRKPQPTMGKVAQWFYLHLPMTAGIAADLLRGEELAVLVYGEWHVFQSS